MLTEERVGEMISAQTDELREDFDAIDGKIGDLVRLGPEIDRLSTSTDSLERSLVEIAKANRDALQQLGVSIEGIDEAVQTLEDDAKAIEDLPERVVVLEEKQTVDDDGRKDRAATWQTLRIVGALATVLVLPLVGFLGKTGWDDYRGRGARMVTQSHKVAANEAAIERHEESPGHEPLRERVNALEGSVVGINTSLKNIERAQTEARREHNEGLQDLQREIRRRR